VEMLVTAYQHSCVWCESKKNI